MKRKILDGLTEERGGAALETGLILSLGAFFALVVREVVASPLLAQLTRAAKVISQALA
nr:hypothetical protein [Caulobacter sp. RHG1]